MGKLQTSFAWGEHVTMQSTLLLLARSYHNHCQVVDAVKQEAIKED